MPNLKSKQPYSKIAIRKYIGEKFNISELRLLCHDDDDELNNLGNFFDGLAEAAIFEIKVLELVSYAERTNKFDKLVSLLKNERKDLDDYIKQYAQPLSSAPTRTNYRLSNIKNETWAKSGEMRAGLESPITQPAIYEGQDTESAPQFERSHRDIERLENNIESLGEIDDLLGDLDNLLDSMRKKISALLVDIKVRHQSMQDEKLNLVQKPNIFQREQKAKSQINRATFDRQQVFSSPPSSSGGWGETQYPKPN